VHGRLASVSGSYLAAVEAARDSGSRAALRLARHATPPATAPSPGAGEEQRGTIESCCVRPATHRLARAAQLAQWWASGHLQPAGEHRARGRTTGLRDGATTRGPFGRNAARPLRVPEQPGLEPAGRRSRNGRVPRILRRPRTAAALPPAASSPKRSSTWTYRASWSSPSRVP
jgi:hypothetical protein